MGRKEFIERRLAEIDRGREVAARNQRRQDLERLVECRRVRRSYPPPSPSLMAQHFVGGVCVGEYNVADDDYPSVVLMATIMLAVDATSGPDAPVIPPVVTDLAERMRKDIARTRMRNNLARAEDALK